MANISIKCEHSKNANQFIFSIMHLYLCFSMTTSNIANWKYYNCSSLTSVSIPKSVTTIGLYAFDWCKFAAERLLRGLAP